eukprot:11047067-Lingulodinium_polyedra.AAC.1
MSRSDARARSSLTFGSFQRLSQRVSWGLFARVPGRMSLQCQSDVKLRVCCRLSGNGVLTVG